MENTSSSLSSSSMQHFNQFDDIFNHGVAICNIFPERSEGVYDIESWPFSLESIFVQSASNTSLCEEVEEAVDTISEVGSCLDNSAMTVEKGLELVNLLLSCAEAVGCRDTSVASATLNQIWLLANPNGDSLQRVSFCFAIGLRSRLCFLRNIGSSGSLSSTTIAMDSAAIVTKEEKLEAFYNLYQTTPYISFGFMAANEAIHQAAQGKDRLHIVDLGMSHALQWPSLVQMLASRPGGPPSIRITGVATPGTNLLELESTMALLIDEARRIRVRLEFRILHESSLATETLQLRQGEVLFVNSMMHLHKYVKESRGSLKAFLVAIRKLKPALVTIIEQDANHNGPFFLGRFLESLHYYSAVFDSLEASLARGSPERTKIESGYFLDEITNIIACEGGERVERHERADQWRRQLGRAGFQGVALKSINETRMLVSSYGCDGYMVGSEKGCLLLGWKGRPIMWASAWQVNPASSC